MTRYALYFAPGSESPWWQAGCEWLGRDPETAEVLAQTTIDGMAVDVQQQLTRDARRYGFHATLKAPFRLQDGKTLAELKQQLAEFSEQQSSFYLPPLSVQWIGNFLALQPTGDSSALNELAFNCVKYFDHFRAPMTQAELARRQQHGLNERQLELLQRWGYPYTAGEFRFHMTLTDRLEADDHASLLQAAAMRHFQLECELHVDGIALFAESQSGADFQLIERFSFT